MSGKEAKKPVSRDISDLKARLGLKRSGGAPQRQGGNVPAPPGVQPPPGIQPPAGVPSQPIPDARQDPFGAMNATAAQAGATAAPAPIVIVDDGKGKAQTSGKGKLLMAGAALLAGLVVGHVMGGISYKNGEYNATISEAKALTDVVKDTGKPLENLNNTLLLAKERGAGQNAFKLHDKELTAELEALDLKKPNWEVLLTSRLLNMQAPLIEDTLLFYSDLHQLYDLVNRHVRMAKAEEKVIDANKPPGDKLGTQLPFGVVFEKGKDNQPTMAQIVQVGMPLCADKKPNPQGCGAVAPAGFQYRPDVTTPQWGSKAFDPQGVATENVVLLKPTGIWNVLWKGSERFYADIAYTDRVEQIDEMTKALSERRKSIENRLNQKAQESTRLSL